MAFVTPSNQQSSRRAVLFFAGLLMASVHAADAPPDEDALSVLYLDMEAAGEMGREALQDWRGGQLARGAEGFELARRALAAIAARCRALSDCDTAKVILAQDRLLGRQQQALREGVPAEALEEMDLAADEAADPDEENASPLLADVPASAQSVGLFRGRDLGAIVENSEPIQAALRELLTWLRPNLLDAYEHYRYLRYRMWPVYEEAGLPEALLFGMLAQESGGKVHARSRAGAAGPLQFMRSTGRRYGLVVEDGFDTRYDPEAATRANVAYLQEQFARLNDDLELALGAYNGGEGRMARLSPRGSRRFWDPSVSTKLPRETREYVPMVLAAAWLFLHPERYGLRFPEIADQPAQFALQAALTLNELSICLGQSGNERGWFRTLRNLNPRWDPNKRLDAGTVLEAPAALVEAYERQCTADTVLAELRTFQNARIPGVELAPHLAGGNRTHVVRKGENLSGIARRHGCGYGDIPRIARANRIAAPTYALRIGQKLEIPHCGA